LQLSGRRLELEQPVGPEAFAMPVVRGFGEEQVRPHWRIETRIRVPAGI
jgi:hypothetical protein